MNEEQLRALIRDVIKGELGELQEERTNRAAMVATVDRPNGKGGEKEKGEDAGRFILAVTAGKFDPERAVKFAKSRWEDDEELHKALESGSDPAGGFIVPPSYSREIIELLYPMTVVRSSNPVIWPMPNGTAEVPKLTGGVQAEYVGENQNITTDQPDFGQVALVWKKLACNVPISNDLLRFSAPNAEVVVRNDLAMSLAVREDRAFLRDDGTGQKPRGMRFQSGISTRAATGGTAPTLAQVRADVTALVLAMENSNMPMIRPVWHFAPRIKHFLGNLADGNGNLIYKDELDRGEFYGLPYKTTTQIPTNLGAGTNESEIYLADYAQVVIGEASELIIEASSVAAYHDGTAVQSAWSRDQTVIRAIARHDFGLRHALSVAILTGVQWGA